MPGSKTIPPAVWLRFLPHVFPPDAMLSERVIAISDEGAVLDLAGCELRFIPARFLHSPGNFSVHDPCSCTLFPGELLSSLPPLEEDRDSVEGFSTFVKHAELFHKCYTALNRAIRAWLSRIEELEIGRIVPQHGPANEGRDKIDRGSALAKKSSVRDQSYVNGYRIKNALVRFYRCLFRFLLLLRLVLVIPFLALARHTFRFSPLEYLCLTHTVCIATKLLSPEALRSPEL